MNLKINELNTSTSVFAQREIYIYTFSCTTDGRSTVCSYIVKNTYLWIRQNNLTINLRYQKENCQALAKILVTRDWCLKIYDGEMHHVDWV